MCLLAVATGVAARFPLVLLHNRDELRDRPVATGPEDPAAAGMLCVRDAEAGGTWLAVGARTGTVVALTNRRSPAELAADRNGLGAGVPPGMRSRGLLVADAAAGRLELGAAGDVPLGGARYLGFNAVVADASRGSGAPAAWFVTNRPGGAELDSAARGLPLAPGEVHAVANGAANDAAEERVVFVRRAVAAALAEHDAAARGGGDKGDNGDDDDADSRGEAGEALALAERLLAVMEEPPAYCFDRVAPTRSQTVVLVGATAVHYFYRGTDSGDASTCAVQCHRVPRPVGRVGRRPRALAAAGWAAAALAAAFAAWAAARRFRAAPSPA